MQNFWPNRNLGEQPIQWNQAKCCGPTLVAIATKFGLFLHKIAYKLACMADRLEMFGLPRRFWGWPIQWNHAKCCGADPCCHGNEIWARHRDPVAYRFVTFIATDIKSNLGFVVCQRLSVMVHSTLGNRKQPAVQQRFHHKYDVLPARRERFSNCVR